MSEINRYSRVAKLNGVKEGLLLWAEQVKPGFCTGKTTAHLLGLISQAMKQPEVPLKVTTEYDKQNMTAQGGLYYVLEELLDKLKLDCMEFSKIKGTLTYYPYMYFKTGYIEIGHKPVGEITYG